MYIYIQKNNNNMYIIDNSITKTRKFILVTYTRDSKMSRKKKHVCILD